MKGIHWADLGTCGKSEVCAPISQQVPQKQSRNASWCPILDLPRRVFDVVRCYSALKLFRMPKYHTVHHFFPYLYLFWRNPITSPQLYMLWTYCTGGYGWKSFYQLRSFISGPKLSDPTVEVSYSHRLRSMRLELVGLFRMYWARAIKISHSCLQDRLSWIRPGRIIYFWCSVYVSHLYLSYPSV